MAWYRAGAVGATNGSKNITGASTAWVNNVQPGDAFIGPDGAYYEVDVVGGNGALTLVENYAGTTVPSGGAYKIIPTQGRVRDMAAAVLALINDYSALESALTVAGTNVGIGSAPADYGAGYKTLAVNGSTAGVLDLMAGSSSALRIFSSTTEARLQGVLNVPMTFYINNTERMRIDNAGRLLIGRNVGNVTALKFALEGRMESCALGSHAYSYGAATGANAFVINESSSGAEVERLRIDSSGNVGIGVVPVAGYGRTLAISQGAGTAHPIILHQAADTNDERMYVNNNATPPAGGFTGTFNYNKSGCAATSYLQRAGEHTWSTAPVGTAGAAAVLLERLKIDVAGNTLIRLQTAAPTLASDGEFNIIKISDTVIRLRMRGSDGATRSADITLA